MIVVCGDGHAEFPKVSEFINKNQKITTILQCGDFGFWPRFHGKSSVNKYTGKLHYFDQYKLKNKDVMIFFCDGNHEDHESLRNLKDNEIMKNVFYMERGSILTLPDGRNVLFIGGAYSIDKNQRIIGESWFPEETISQKDIYDLPDEKVDIVISHTAPNEFKVVDYHDEYGHDPSRDALSFVLKKYKPSLWYFGHMHKYQQGFDCGCKWTCLSYIGHNQKWWAVLD